MGKAVVLAFAAMLAARPVNAEPETLNKLPGWETLMNLTGCAVFYGLVRGDRDAPVRFSSSHHLALTRAMNLAKARNIRPHVWQLRYAKDGDEFLAELNAPHMNREDFIARYDPICSAHLKKSE